MLEDAGHFDQADASVLHPLELWFYCDFIGMGSFNFDSRKTRDRYLQHAWLFMRFLDKVGLASPLSNIKTLDRLLAENRNGLIYKELLDHIKKKD